MNPQSPTPPPLAGRRHRIDRKLIVALVAGAVVALTGAGFGLWYILVGPSGPSAVGSGSPVFPANASVPAPASLDGTWMVNDSLGSMSDATASWVGYRVTEKLVGVGGHTAIGRTPKVTGSMTVTGSTVATVLVTADLTALASDDSLRDGQLHRQAINTDQFPTATFKSIAPINLGALPADGTTVSATARGALTLHGVTQTVSIQLQAVRRGGIIAVTGTLPIVFADYGFAGPTSFSVLSVDDRGTIELHLLFTPSGA